MVDTLKSMVAAHVAMHATMRDVAAAAVADAKRAAGMLEPTIAPDPVHTRPELAAGV